MNKTVRGLYIGLVGKNLPVNNIGVAYKDGAHTSRGTAWIKGRKFFDRDILIPVQEYIDKHMKK